MSPALSTIHVIQTAPSSDGYTTPQVCHCGESNCKGVIGVEKEIKDTGSKAKSSKKLIESSEDESGNDSEDDSENDLENEIKEEFVSIEQKQELERKALEDSDDDEEYSYSGNDSDDEHRYVGRHGLQTSEEVLKLVQIMLRSSGKKRHIQLITSKILETRSKKLLQMFVSFHGLRILRLWIIENSDDETIIIPVLQCIRIMPIKTRNTIDENKIEPCVIGLSKNKDEFIADLATEILKIWSALKFVYKIPKRKPGQEINEISIPSPSFAKKDLITSSSSSTKLSSSSIPNKPPTTLSEPQWGSTSDKAAAGWGAKIEETPSAWGSKTEETSNEWTSKPEDTSTGWNSKPVETNSGWDSKPVETGSGWDPKPVETTNGWGAEKGDASSSWGASAEGSGPSGWGDKSVGASNTWNSKPDTQTNSWSSQQASKTNSWDSKPNNNYEPRNNKPNYTPRPWTSQNNDTPNSWNKFDSGKDFSSNSTGSHNKPNFYRGGSKPEFGSDSTIRPNARNGYRPNDNLPNSNGWSSNSSNTRPYINPERQLRNNSDSNDTNNISSWDKAPTVDNNNFGGWGSTPSNSGSNQFNPSNNNSGWANSTPSKEPAAQTSWGSSNSYGPSTLDTKSSNSNNPSFNSWGAPIASNQNMNGWGNTNTDTNAQNTGGWGTPANPGSSDLNGQNSAPGYNPLLASNSLSNELPINTCKYNGRRLKPGWYPAKSDKDEVYFFHESSKQVQWEPPYVDGDINPSDTNPATNSGSNVTPIKSADPSTKVKNSSGKKVSFNEKSLKKPRSESVSKSSHSSKRAKTDAKNSSRDKKLSKKDLEHLEKKATANLAKVVVKVLMKQGLDFMDKDDFKHEAKKITKILFEKEKKSASSKKKEVDFKLLIDISSTKSKKIGEFISTYATRLKEKKSSENEQKTSDSSKSVETDATIATKSPIDEKNSEPSIVSGESSYTKDGDKLPVPMTDSNSADSSNKS
ncbi:Histone-lysine N-methyltransferase, H3 lysine-36 specific [Smittium culicis]|uniref:Histone-lysine N-methyltransferase, H3 lysine-36 specific n=1 Tax=Smittium culicis TaxID=133412 RepID=A0A1R1Y958_9FUNG|nr:Histone-lysine N-methyltransferase, H3 lysine-36 specific [Smittium culicis]